MLFLPLKFQTFSSPGLAGWAERCVAVAVIFVRYVRLYLPRTPEGARRDGACFSLKPESFGAVNNKRETQGPRDKGTRRKTLHARPVLLELKLLPHPTPTSAPKKMEINSFNCKIMKCLTNKQNQRGIDYLIVTIGLGKTITGVHLSSLLA